MNLSSRIPNFLARRDWRVATRVGVNWLWQLENSFLIGEEREDYIRDRNSNIGAILWTIEQQSKLTSIEKLYYWVT